MSSFVTRCPKCQRKNRLPEEKMAEHPKCGNCQSALIDGEPIEGTIDNLSALMNGNLPIVIDFWAPWCNPCVGFAPVFQDSAASFNGKARFLKINTEEQTELSQQYRIRSIPTIMLFKEGRLIDSINGALPKSQFEQWLTQALEK